MNPIRRQTCCFVAMIYIAILAPTAVGQDPRIRAPSDNSSQNDLLAKILNGEFSPQAYKPADEDDKITRLEKQRICCGYYECASIDIRVREGSEKIDLLLEAKRRLSLARLEFHRDKDERIQVLKEQLDDAKTLENSFSDRVTNGLVRPDDLAKAAYFRVTTELELERLKRSNDIKEAGK